MQSKEKSETQSHNFFLKKARLYLFIFFQILVVLGTLFVVGMTIATCFGSLCLVCEVLTHFRVQYTISLLLAIPLLFLFKARWFLIPVAIGLLINILDIVPLYLGQGKIDGKPSIRILSLNVYGDNRNSAAILDAIEKADADVVFVQELIPEMNTILQAQLTQYPYRFVKPRPMNFGIGMFSKIPLENTKAFELSGADIDTQSAEINLDGQRVTLVNIHTIAPINDLCYSWRNSQIAGLAKLSKATDQPVIAVGDLNATCFSPFFKSMLEEGNFKDSEVGFGIQLSWTLEVWGLPKFTEYVLKLPLDHVLLKGPFQVLDRRLLDDIGSDHLPLSVSLALKRTP